MTIWRRLWPRPDRATPLELSLADTAGDRTHQKPLQHSALARARSWSSEVATLGASPPFVASPAPTRFPADRNTAMFTR